MSANSVSEVLLDAPSLAEKIRVLADGLAAFVDDPERTAIIGIMTRGATLAQRVHDILLQEKRWDLPVGLLDITLYRDDPSQLASHPLVRKTDLDFDVENRTILLIDDVLYTGRTIRSALDQIVDFGRPRAVKLGVLVDRGLREYPIQADVAVLSVPTTEEQTETADSSDLVSVSFDDILTDYAAAYRGLPDPDTPWPIVVMLMNRTARYDSRARLRLLDSMTSAIAGAFGAGKEVEAQRDRLIRDAYPDQAKREKKFTPNTLNEEREEDS